MIYSKSTRDLLKKKYAVKDEEIGKLARVLFEVQQNRNIPVTKQDVLDNAVDIIILYCQQHEEAT